MSIDIYNSYLNLKCHAKCININIEMQIRTSWVYIDICSLAEIGIEKRIDNRNFKFALSGWNAKDPDKQMKKKAN